MNSNTYNNVVESATRSNTESYQGDDSIDEIDLTNTNGQKVIRTRKRREEETHERNLVHAEQVERIFKTFSEKSESILNHVLEKVRKEAGVYHRRCRETMNEKVAMLKLLRKKRRRLDELINCWMNVLNGLLGDEGEEDNGDRNSALASSGRSLASVDDVFGNFESAVDGVNSDHRVKRKETTFVESERQMDSKKPRRRLIMSNILAERTHDTQVFRDATHHSGLSSSLP